jgi:hypothetical protein
MTKIPSLDGRTLRSASAVEGGEVDADTVFRFRQEGDVVHAQYFGGNVRLGFLVGRIEGEAPEASGPPPSVRSGGRVPLAQVRLRQPINVQAGPRQVSSNRSTLTVSVETSRTNTPRALKR